MEKTDQLSLKDQKDLLECMERLVGLTMPDDKDRLGAVSFHLYRYENEESASSWAFQIRWGVHTIHNARHLTITSDTPVLPQLENVINKARTAIKNELIKYCENQLNTVVTLEMEPELNSRNINLFGYELKVCKGRSASAAKNNYGWPGFCVFIAWYDDLGDFQEFLYPIRFDSEARRFLIPASQIVSKFQVYRDSLI